MPMNLDRRIGTHAQNPLDGPAKPGGLRRFLTHGGRKLRQDLARRELSKTHARKQVVDWAALGGTG